jgi:hypothetical protein
VREDPAKLLSNTLLGKTRKVPALRLLGSLGSARPWVAGFTRAKLEVTFCGALTLTKKAVKQAKKKERKPASVCPHVSSLYACVFACVPVFHCWEGF